jgi:demethylmenaquinone methyltransferase/2-methoxy-6-polyprenyl-1,4-benzoquinol methylase
MTNPPGTHDRFEPHAANAMASMFDGVSPRYDLLNRLMTLGQDGAWRRAMAGAVPERARIVLDLCTGSGVSLAGLRRPGRTVLGIDVSVAMLERADAEQGGGGWAPRLACADAFRLPLRDASLDAITIAFGIRNLRPRAAAALEIARVLRPGGTLAVLEAAAPRPGPFAPFHRFWIRHLIPLLGRLSPDPSAYRYLSESILEFGPGTDLEQALLGAGLVVAGRRSFLLGATRLWIVRRPVAHGEKAAVPPATVQNAILDSGSGGEFPQTDPGAGAEYRAWTIAQLAVAIALLGALVAGLALFLKSSARLPLDSRGRALALVLLILGTLFSAARVLALLRRMIAPPSRR